MLFSVHAGFNKKKKFMKNDKDIIFIRFPSINSLYDEINNQINVEMFLQRPKTQNNLTIQKGSIFYKALSYTIKYQTA